MGFSNANITYLGAFIAGLLSFLSPCVLPLIPSYVTYITGISFSQLDAEHPGERIRLRTFLHSVLFVSGFTVVFVLLGASATLVGAFLQDNIGIVRRVAGIMVVLFGIHVTGLVPIGWLLGERRINIRKKPAGYPGSFIVGIAFAAGWTPCIGPMLASILMMVATDEKAGQGMFLLLTYSAGLGIPFILSSLALHRFIMFFNRFKKHIRLFEITSGLFLVLLGLLIYMNWLSVISAYTNTLFIR